jgi:hypothetical protein
MCDLLDAANGGLDAVAKLCVGHVSWKLVEQCNTFFSMIDRRANRTAASESPKKKELYEGQQNDCWGDGNNLWA